MQHNQVINHIGADAGSAKELSDGASHGDCTSIMEQLPLFFLPKAPGVGPP